MHVFKYRIGARVKILIGHYMWKTNGSVDPKVYIHDMRPDLVGKNATIKTRTIVQGLQRYGLEIDGVGYMAWFGLKQIERV